MFGSLLKQSKFIRDYKYEDVLILARTAVNANEPRSAEFLTLVDKAIKIYNPVKKKKKG
jgi:Ca-activated chloride channel family protein